MFYATHWSPQDLFKNDTGLPPNCLSTLDQSEDGRSRMSLKTLRRNQRRLVSSQAFVDNAPHGLFLGPLASPQDRVSYIKVLQFLKYC